ncbi:MAG: hypothetical protein ACYTEQ_14750, partial [Planctomycetota bacterium]
MDRLEIVNEVHRHIPFFRDTWETFCEMVEEHAEYIMQCRANPALAVDMQKDDRLEAEADELFREGNRLLNKRNKADDPQEIAKFEDQAKRKHSQSAAKEAERAVPPKPGYERYYWGNSKYLNVPMGKVFWIGPEPLNPLLWFGKAGCMRASAPTPVTPEHSFLWDCVLLSIVHDHEDSLDHTEEKIYRDNPYKGKYFRRDDFSCDVWWEKKDDAARVQRAWGHVIASPEFQEWCTKAANKSQTKPPRKEAARAEHSNEPDGPLFFDSPNWDAPVHCPACADPERTGRMSVQQFKA